MHRFSNSLHVLMVHPSARTMGQNEQFGRSLGNFQNRRNVRFISVSGKQQLFRFHCSASKNNPLVIDITGSKI
jgi:hypothetical protein